MSLRTAAAALAVVAALPAAARERSEVPEQYRWDLTALYPSQDAWARARADVQARLPELARFRGHLGDSAAALRKGLDAYFGLDRDLSRLMVYASLLSDEDTRVAGPRELRQAAQQLAVELGSAAAFVRPELLAVDAKKLRRFLAQDRGLAPYRMFLDDVLRWKPHTLPVGEERVAAEAGAMAVGPSSVYGVLKDADLPYRTVKLSTGEEARMDQSGFSLHRQSRVTADRDATFEAYFGALGDYRRTLGATLYAQVQSDIFTRKARHFGSALEAALFPSNIPTEVYDRLVRDVRRSLPTFHRYLALRKRMLGLDVLRFQDLYVPMVESVDLRYDPEEARRVTLEAVAPLGPDYVAVLKKGFESRWTDYLPSTGKRAGAYSWGAYGVHPYQLLNFNGQYDDLSTLAHESGHSMHTWLAMTTQPYATSDYATFVAEVASTLNENLLVHHLLARAKDDATRLFLLGNQLDGLRATLFRQTQFAEFELAIHRRAEKGETLTGENLSALYLEIAREYHGHDQGVCRIDDLVGAEWAGIPHFYRNFYVYQYATSLVASTSLARGLREEAARGETRRRDAYLDMLRAGSSKYPIQLLRDAGIDMTTSAPFDAAIAEMNGIMDEMERILARHGGKAPAPGQG